MACPFCSIASNYPPDSDSAALSNSELTTPSAFVVLSTPLCMAFLDIMPLSPGHLLLTTRKHNEKLSDVSAEESRELGEWLPKLSRALAKVTGVWDWNIVQNNGSFTPPSSSILPLQLRRSNKFRMREGEKEDHNRVAGCCANKS
jgi:diadenosine tetraphosphate (Ap4A) HIT family hydrolase